MRRSILRLTFRITGVCRRCAGAGRVFKTGPHSHGYVTCSVCQ